MNNQTLPGFFLVLFFATFLQQVYAGTTAGVVLATAGKVDILRDGQTLTAARKGELQVRDEIRTGKNARAQLRFADGTITTLGGDTTFVIQQFDWQEKPAKAASVQMTLLTGAFRTVTGQALDTAGSSFTVKTPVGVIGIRGTDFWGGYLDGDDIDVLLINGKHAVEVSNANGKVRLEKPGEGVTLKHDKSMPVVKVWPEKKVNRAVATITWPDGSIPPATL